MDLFTVHLKCKFGVYLSFEFKPVLPLPVLKNLDYSAHDKFKFGGTNYLNKVKLLI